MFLSTSIGTCVVDCSNSDPRSWEDFFKLIGTENKPVNTKSPNLFVRDCNVVSPEFSDDTIVLSHKVRKILYHRQDKSFCILYDATSCARTWVWRLGMFCSCLSYMLRHGNALIIHGALLEMPDGSGVALCAPSGVGKSTTARRWRAAGGTCFSDDLFWIVWENDGVYAYPLPTWSCCMQSLAGKFFPVDHRIPLKAMLALRRGTDHESIETLPFIQYQFQIYSSAIFYELTFLPRMPLPEREMTIKMIQQNALKLASMFKSESLYATLDGNLKSTLKKFCE